MCSAGEVVVKVRRLEVDFHRPEHRLQRAVARTTSVVDVKRAAVDRMTIDLPVAGLLDGYLDHFKAHNGFDLAASGGWGSLGMVGDGWEVRSVLL